MEQKFDFEDINLVAAKCIVNSRKECNTAITLGQYNFKVPLVPANMRAVIDEDLCVWLAQNDYFYVMHRFEVDQIAFVKKMKTQGLIASISIGVKAEDKVLLTKLKTIALIPEFITIDIAHGYGILMEEMLQFIRACFKDTPVKPFIIAGNIMTIEAARDLAKWGADAVKFGIGPGKVCTTKLKTGFGTGGWQLNALKDLFDAKCPLPIIADGGIRCNGDIVKAVAFGADMVMAGSILAGHDESPGQVYTVDDQVYKEYYGSASIFNKVERVNIEGKRIFVEHKGTIKNTYQEIQEDLQSAISYAGGKNLLDLRNCKYVIVKGTITNSDDR